LLLFICSVILVIFSSNPVYSALFLILSFLSSSAILFLLKVDFLGILFIIIYVGAIAVLFLFVVMMLNIKINTNSKVKYWTFPLILCFFFTLYIAELLENVFFNLNTFELEEIFFLDSLSNTQLVGQAVYNYFITSILLAGLVLLVSMLGAILLTLNFKRKTQLNYYESTRQLSRLDTFLSKFN